MSRFKGLPTVDEVAKFQKAALAYLLGWMTEDGVDVGVEGAGPKHETTLVPSRSYKVIAHVDEGRSPVIALWVYLGSYDGSGGYGEWYTKLDGEWVSTENLSDYDGSSGEYSWEVE